MYLKNLSRKSRNALLFSIISASIIGCKSIGPHQVYLDRNRYNVALQTTQSEELLTNIVRMRYYEPISFLQVTGVTSSYSFSPSISATPGISYESGSGPSTTTSSGSFTTSANYSDSPTISYAPIASSDFINILLTPVQLNQLSYLTSGGTHDPNLIFKLVIESLNDIDNAASASDSKVQTPPNYQQYYEFLSELKKLNKAGSIRIINVQLNGSPTIAIRVGKSHMHDPEVNHFRSFLRIPQSTRIIALSATPSLTSGVIGVETRSVMAMMNYLSHSVQAPVADVKNGTISLYRLADGTPFDWAPLMHGLMTIRCSDSDPGDVFVKTYLHRHWFYITNNDFDSKLTFSFLNNLIILTAGGHMNPNLGAPILTIPTR